jgi:hypothetical protein
MKDGMDTLKINKITFYADGEYRLDAVGKSYATKEFNRMKKDGHKVRLVKRTTGYQVYCDSKLGVMGR